MIFIILSWLMIGFFTIGAIINWFQPPNIKADYSRWGYPAWFHYITAILELMTAILIFFEPTHFIGLSLGLVVMFSALATLIRHKEYKHTIIPLIILMVLTILIVHYFLIF